VGLNDTGGIDKEIPGSNYLASENESIIAFPGNSEGTKVVVKGIQKGIFNLSGYINISGYNEAISYSDINVSEKTVATVDINSSTANYNSPSDTKSIKWKVRFPMEVDYNGDGVIDEVIEPDYTNILPKAEFTVSTYEPTVNGKIIFDASGSNDIDGYIKRYTWYFGDGGSSTGRITTHSYKSTGDYIIALKVADNKAGLDFTLKTIHVYQKDREPRVGQNIEATKLGDQSVIATGNGQATNNIKIVSGQ
jgi:hypothetical protein